MDLFCECLVKKQRDAKDLLINIGVCVLALIMSVLALTFNVYIFGFGILIFVLCWYGAYNLIKLNETEFEYTITQNEMDIDKIMGKKKRKRIITVDLNEIEVLEKFVDKNGNSTKKVYNCFGSLENDIYFIDFLKDGVPSRVIFEPSERMKEVLKKANPKVVRI